MEITIRLYDISLKDITDALERCADFCEANRKDDDCESDVKTLRVISDVCFKRINETENQGG